MTDGPCRGKRIFRGRSVERGWRSSAIQGQAANDDNAEPQCRRCDIREERTLSHAIVYLLANLQGNVEMVRRATAGEPTLTIALQLFALSAGHSSRRRDRLASIGTVPCAL